MSMRSAVTVDMRVASGPVCSVPSIARSHAAQPEENRIHSTLVRYAALTVRGVFGGTLPVCASTGQAQRCPDQPIGLPVVHVPLGVDPPKLADVDGDLDQDLITSGSTGCSVALNDGSGLFGTPAEYTTGTGGRHLAV